ncbi:MAG: nucleotide disphospho-sugar-binding domain-containing protein [Xanthobacteraceae bacterium]
MAGGDSVRKYEEESLLAAVNVALHRLGRQALDRLPAIFAADAAIVATFAELDPYARERDGTYAAPFVPSWDRATPSGGSEIFVYFAETIAAFPAVIASIEHVVRTERTVRLHVPNLDAGIERWLAAAGVSVERMPVPFGQIAARSRLIVSHGSCGIASASLAAGIAQAIIPTDLEKRLIGDAVQRTGAGRSFRTSRDNPLEGALLGQAIVEALHDEALAASARALAPGFAKRLETDPADVVARQVAELV